MDYKFCVIAGAAGNITRFDRRWFATEERAAEHAASMLRNYSDRIKVGQDDRLFVVQAVREVRATHSYLLRTGYQIEDRPVSSVDDYRLL